MNSPDQDHPVTKTLSNHGLDIRNIVLIIVGVIASVFILVPLITDFTNTVDSIKCLVPDNPVEILLGFFGMIGLTIVGVPFLPATVLGLGIWSVIKYWICHT
jgi:hypothetical protein